MTESDLQRLEAALGISLPSVYRKMMTSFPVPAYAGNSETMLWDDADALLALNRELRTGRHSTAPWPRRFFALGQDAGGCSDALDLDDPQFGVFWFDRQHIHATADERSPEKVEQWLARQIREMCSDLLDGGVAPEASPENRKAAQQKAQRSSNFALLFFALILGGVLLAGIWIGMNR